MQRWLLLLGDVFAFSGTELIIAGALLLAEMEPGRKFDFHLPQSSQTLPLALNFETAGLRQGPPCGSTGLLDPSAIHQEVVITDSSVHRKGSGLRGGTEPSAAYKIALTSKASTPVCVF